jgi:hypothetical protein
LFKIFFFFFLKKKKKKKKKKRIYFEMALTIGETAAGLYAGSEQPISTVRGA